MLFGGNCRACARFLPAVGPGAGSGAAVSTSKAQLQAPASCKCWGTPLRCRAKGPVPKGGVECHRHSSVLTRVVNMTFDVSVVKLIKSFCCLVAPRQFSLSLVLDCRCCILSVERFACNLPAQNTLQSEIALVPIAYTEVVSRLPDKQHII